MKSPVTASSVAALLDEAGYESLEELKDEIDEQRREYETSSGQKKTRAKEDLDEMLRVLAQCSDAKSRRQPVPLYRTKLSEPELPEIPVSIS